MDLLRPLQKLFFDLEEDFRAVSVRAIEEGIHINNNKSNKSDCLPVQTARGFARTQAGARVESHAKGGKDTCQEGKLLH
jgi:hypothetical protein